MCNHTITIVNEANSNNDCWSKPNITKEEWIADESEPYEFDPVLDGVDIKEMVEQKKESENESERFTARVFYYSKYRYKNVRQFSRVSKIPYNVCLSAYNKFLTHIRCRISSL